VNLNQPLDPAQADNPQSIMSELRASGDADPAISDLAAATRPKRRFNVQTLVVALTVFASAACLYMMRQQGKGAGFTFQNVKLDLEPDKVAAASANHARIMADLVRSTQAPVAVEKLDKNPFRLAAVELPAAPASPQAPTIDRESEEIARALAGLHVNAIMQGRVPIARINGQLVKVGDIIEGKLMVAQINERSVDFLAAGKRYTVNMGDPATRPQRAPTPPRFPGGYR
jgi:hypothetical protein